MFLLNGRWWIRSVERMLKTAAQMFVFLVGADQLTWMTLDWKSIGISTGVMALLSLATSILTTPAGDDPTSPSVVR